MKRFEDQIATHQKVSLHLSQELIKLRTEIEHAKEVIQHHELVMGHVFTALEINNRVRTHYNYLSVADNDEKMKLLQSDLDELTRVQEVLQQLSVNLEAR